MQKPLVDKTIQCHQLTYTTFSLNINFFGLFHGDNLKCLYGQQGFYSYGSSILCKKVF